jgi:RHS repeat-associated protein
MKMKDSFSRFCAFAILLLVSCSVVGQVSTGTPRWGSFSSGPDVIDLGNLNMNFTAPVFSKPGRGMPFTYVLRVDTSVWYPVGISGSQAWTPVFNWGWRAQTEVVTGELTYRVSNTKCFDDPAGWYWGLHYTGFAYHDPFGTVHGFTLSYTSCATDPGPHPTTANDGSGLVFDGFSTIGTPTGQRLTPPVNTGSGSGTATDHNGNQISAGSSSFTDTLGMTVLSVSGGAPNPVNLTYTDSSGTPRSVTVNYGTYTVQTNFGCTGIAEYGPTTNYLVSSIGYPDGSSYSFTYEPTPGGSGNVTGRVQSITLRAGATITYTYTGGNNGIMCSDGSTAGLTRTTSDTNNPTTAYARSGSGTAWTTTITDAQSNQTVINFQTAAGGTGANFYETHRTVNQGSSTALMQTDTCYNGNIPNPNCNSFIVVPPITEVKKYLTLSNNQQSLTDTILDSTGLLTKEVDEYDFGSGAPGALLRKTLATYATLGSTIIALPATVTVQDGSGSQKALTVYGYDETAVSATSGVPQHIAIPSFRGNLTSLSRWMDTNNSSLATGFAYDDTGNVLTSTDSAGHQTQFSYTDNFSDNVNRSSLAYVTQLTLPDTNSPNLAHHITKSQYDANTGLPVNTWDQNNQQTTFTYDLLLRPLQTNFPDGGQSNISYQSTTQTLVQNKIDSTRSTSSYTQVDSYGRLSRTALANGESTPYDQQDFCYDSNGRLQFQSYPYQGSGFGQAKVCSGAGDSFSYDALGRITQLTHSDGTNLQYSYSGRAQQIADEGNGTYSVSRIMQSDGLGRLTGVCEVSANTLLGTGGAPASCGLDIAATGFLTSYSYNTLDKLTTVTQGALTNRTYTYDSLSRMTSESNPEWGSGSTTTYAYNNDGMLISRTRPAPNQTNTATTVTTNYGYDALHRLLSRTYTGDTTGTPSAALNYDEASAWSQTLSNTVGRMSSKSSGSTGQAFSYDMVGRVISNWQFTPRVWGGTPYLLSYGYDLAGDLTSAGNGAGVTFTYSYNTAPRLTGMTSNLVDAQHPATLLSNAHYSPATVTDTLGNGLAETSNFSPRGMLMSYVGTTPTGQPGTGSVGISGTLQSQTLPATPGTGSVTFSGSEQSKPGAPATAGRGSVTISGEEVNPCLSAPKLAQIPQIGCSADHGSVFIVVNGHSDQAGFGSTDTPSSIASKLVTAINGDTGAFVNANCADGPCTNATVYLTGRSPGSGTNYSLSSSVTQQLGSFSTSNSGATLTGGANAGPTVYDHGTCTVTINGTPYSGNFGQSDNATSIASGLAGVITSGSLASATASGATISLTAKAAGTASDYSLSGSCTYDSSTFSGPSFAASPSGSSLVGGTNATTTPDQGTTTITVNNHPDGYSWSGSTTTAASIAQGLCNVINGDSSASVSANTNGTPQQCPSGSTTVNLVSKLTGPNTDYSLVAVSNSSVNSFSTSCPGFPNCTSASLTGGGTPAYSFTLSEAPDGQITSSNDFVNGNWTFSYDQFNRLTGSSKNSGQQTFTYDYDPYGNRWHQNAPQGGPAPQYVFDNNNRISGSGVTYDALGEITADGLGNSFAWDAEGRLIQVNQGSTVIANYVYDAEGRRIKNASFEFVYDLAGRAITLFNATTGGWWYGEIYAGGRHLATYSGGTTNFLHADWLGTKRVMTGVSGANSETCTGFPFGDDVNCTGTNWTFNGFTDDIHDSETNLEHTLFRQLSGTQGRWITPDPDSGSMDITNPQSLNRYAYVMNDPIDQIDPSGLRACIPGSVNFGCPGDSGSGLTCAPLGPGLVKCWSGGGGWIWGGGDGWGGFGSYSTCFVPGNCPYIPFQGLIDHLADLPWNNPCIMSPVSDCGGLTGLEALKPQDWGSGDPKCNTSPLGCLRDDFGKGPCDHLQAQAFALQSIEYGSIDNPFPGLDAVGSGIVTAGVRSAMANPTTWGQFFKGLSPAGLLYGLIGNLFYRTGKSSVQAAQADWRIHKIMDPRFADCGKYGYAPGFSYYPSGNYTMLEILGIPKMEREASEAFVSYAQGLNVSGRSNDGQSRL